MKLQYLGSNKTSVEIGDTTVFFSYNTPVVAFIGGQGWYKTSKKWSVTTSKHVNQFLDDVKATEMPQEWFDRLTEAHEFV